MNGNNHIVFQCYGGMPIFYECIYALLSLEQVHPDAQAIDFNVTIYTDKPTIFEDYFKNSRLDISYYHLNEKEIVAWKGKINFVHRVKIEVLRHFTATHSGNILYADTDVVFTQPLHSIWQQIAKGAKYMHVYEGDIRQRNNPIMKKLDSFLAGFSSPALPSLPTNTAMWNAGLLGFNSDNKQLLDKVLHYTDTVFPHFSKHIVEQFAFSCYFSEEGTLLPAAPYCIHYWNMKEVRKVLEEFVKYSQNLPYQEKLQCFNTIQLPILMQLKGNYYQNLSIIDKLIKKRWQPPSFQAMIGK